MSTVSKKMLTLSVLIAGSTGLILGGAGGCVVGYQMGKSGGVSSATAAAKTYTRDEFRKLVIGKSPDEVIAAVGKPNSTQDYGKGSVNWYYDQRTTDPVTGNLDNTAQLIFENGRVASVNY